MREEDLDAVWEMRVGPVLEDAMHQYRGSQFTENDLELLMAAGYWNNAKQHGKILIGHVVAMCLHSPDTDEWKHTARRSVQIIGDYYNRRNLRSTKLKRIRKIRRRLELIIINERIDYPHEWQNITRWC